jgi:membrane-associated phospholipid phosphatase
MHDLWYEPSKEFIFWLKQFKRPWIDKSMHILSQIGDGDGYFYILIILWSTGKWNKTSNALYEINYVALTYLMCTSLCYILKPIFQKSRPYFDDIELGDTILQDCAAEFGNPSGHSMSAAVVPPILWLVHSNNHKEFLQAHYILKYFILTLVGLFCFLVVFSRIYTGRHTFDQCLTGILSGCLITHFSWCYFKKVFDEQIKKDANHWAQFFKCLFVCVTTFMLACAIYFYIEMFVEIPAHWFDNAMLICTKRNMNNMFHYSSITGLGTMSFCLAFYYYKALASSKKSPLKLKWEEGDTETGSTFFEVILKIVLIVLSD